MNEVNKFIFRSNKVNFLLEEPHHKNAIIFLDISV